MDRFEKALYDVDFSQYSDLKDRLAARLFGSQAQTTSSKVVKFPSRFSKITDDDLFLVNAAQGMTVDEDPFKKEDPEE